MNRAVLERIIENVFTENPKVVSDALTSKKAVKFLIGMVVKTTKGKVDLTTITQIVNRRLRVYRF